METKEDFGCTHFEPGENHLHETIKEGEPWRHFTDGPCPDCGGRGSFPVELRPACRRCSGTGHVRHYDDGYIADQYWIHPKDKEERARERAKELRKLNEAQRLAELPNKSVFGDDNA